MKKKIEVKACYYLGKKDWQFMLLPTLAVSHILILVFA